MRVLYADYSNFTFLPIIQIFIHEKLSRGIFHQKIFECLDLLRLFLVHSWSEVA